MNDQDIFTISTMGLDPKLGDVLESLPLSVTNDILKQKLGPDDDIAAAIANLSAGDAKTALAAAQVVLFGGGLDADELEVVLGAKHAKNVTPYELAWKIVQKIGAPAAKKEIEALYRPGEIPTIGTFADYEAPVLDFTKLDEIGFKQKMEELLEASISDLGDRRVKVRAQKTSTKKPYLVGAVYFDQRSIDGRSITTKKKLTVKSFERAAGHTYFRVAKHQKRTRVTLRSPGYWITSHIRKALGETLWKDPLAIETSSEASYDLDVFKDPNFVPVVHKKYAGDIEKVLVSNIQSISVGGNQIGMKAPGRAADVMDDFRKLTKMPKLFGDGSGVMEVFLKFVSQNDKRKYVATTRIERDQIWLDERQRDIIEDHLEEWGVYGD